MLSTLPSQPGPADDDDGGGGGGGEQQAPVCSRNAVEFLRVMAS